MYYVNPNLVNLHRIVYQNNRKDYLRLDLNGKSWWITTGFY